MPDSPTVIEPDHSDAAAYLDADPIIAEMARELEAAPPGVHDALFPNRRPTDGFTNFAATEYRRRGGTGGQLIGQVAAAILRHLPADPDTAPHPAEETAR